MQRAHGWNTLHLQKVFECKFKVESSVTNSFFIQMLIEKRNVMLHFTLNQDVGVEKSDKSLEKTSAKNFEFVQFPELCRKLIYE